MQRYKIMRGKYLIEGWLILILCAEKLKGEHAEARIASVKYIKGRAKGKNGWTNFYC